jgi:hypothetical protein
MPRPLAVLIGASAGPPAPTRLASTVASSANTTTVSTSAINTTGASLIVAIVAYYVSTGVFADSAGNIWTHATESSTPGCALYYCINPTTSATHTFSIAGGSYPAIAVAAFNNTGPLDLSIRGATGNQPGSGTPTYNGELLVTGYACNQSASGPYTVGSSFTITNQASPVSGEAIGVALAYLVQSTATAVNPTWAGATSQNVAMMASWQP